MESREQHDATSLFRTLDEQAALFHKWLKVDAQKVQAVRLRDVQLMETSVNQQAELLVNLDRLESIRRTLAQRLVPGDSEPTLRAVAKVLPGDLRQQCVHREQVLTDLLAQVQESNRHTDAMVRHAAAHNQVMLDALVGRGSTPGIYGPPGQPGGQASAAPDAHRINRRA